MSGTYRDLEVWQAATQLALQVYRLTAVFPKDERYGMTSQMRRAAVSVASNIAEGKGRSSDKELVQFLCHSRGSLFEIETQHNWRAVGLFHAGRLQLGPTRDSSNWTDPQRTDAISPTAHDSVAH